MNLTDRLITAIVEKCDGLSITAEQASNILAYLQYGAPLTGQPAAIDGAVAWALFADNGNIRIWSRKPEEVERIAAETGSRITPLYADMRGYKPIYQITAEDSDWMDAEKHVYDTWPKHARRIVYAAHLDNEASKPAAYRQGRG